ncbi:MAG: septum formation initiator family protein [Lachnospiraceae bacterium]|nr:septum formation initiator family protein [Lachnospiraceae bacterium]
MARRQRNRVKPKKGMWIVVLVTVVICGALLYGMLKLESKQKALAAEQVRLEMSIEQAKDKSKELDEQKSYMQTDEYVEEVAREKLGMVKDDEILFRPEDK